MCHSEPRPTVRAGASPRHSLYDQVYMHANSGVGLKLHLGCGPHVVPGWENVDKSPSVLLSRTPRLRRGLLRANIINDVQAVGFPKGIRYANVSKRLRYASGAASYVYSSHLIEHLSRWQAVAFVRECTRVLARGGVMRIATPDLRSMTMAYLSGARDLETGWETPADSLMAEVNPFQDLPGSPAQRVIRRQFSGAMHQWLYDARSLTHLLSEGGLPGAELRSFRIGELPDLDVIETRPKSLFVEVRRL